MQYRMSSIVCQPSFAPSSLVKRPRLEPKEGDRCVLPSKETIRPESVMSDEKLVHQLVDCRDYVYRLCYRFLRHEDEAQDAAQDVFVQAYRNLHRFRGDSSLKTWLYHIAENHCLNRLRRKPASSLEDEGFRELADSSDAEEAVEQKVFYQQLRAAIEKKAKTRKPPWDSNDYFIFELYYGEEKMTWPQVAAILGKPVDTVKYHFYQHVLPTIKEVGEEFGG